MKIKSILILFTFITLSFSIAYANSDDMAYFEIGDKKFHLEVVNDTKSIQKGLMYRDSLPDDSGMLFIFQKPVNTSFWMKNVKFPLDILFLKNNKIVKIHKSAQPCLGEQCKLYHSYDYVDSAIELNAGICDKYGIKTGQTLNIY